MSNVRLTETSTAWDAVAITPHDTNALPYAVRALYVGGTGDVTLITEQGNEVTFVGVPAGTILPVRATKVLDSGTDATDLVGLI